MPQDVLTSLFLLISSLLTDKAKNPNYDDFPVARHAAGVGWTVREPLRPTRGDRGSVHPRLQSVSGGFTCKLSSQEKGESYPCLY